MSHCFAVDSWRVAIEALMLYFKLESLFLVAGSITPQRHPVLDRWANIALVFLSMEILYIRFRVAARSLNEGQAWMRSHVKLACMWRAPSGMFFWYGRLDCTRILYTTPALLRCNGRFFGNDQPQNLTLIKSLFHFCSFPFAIHSTSGSPGLFWRVTLLFAVMSQGSDWLLTSCFFSHVFWWSGELSAN